MAPSQPTNPHALAMAHKEALELIAAASRILAATALLHVKEPDATWRRNNPPRRTILNNLENDIQIASNNLYRLRDLAQEIE